MTLHVGAGQLRTLAELQRKMVVRTPAGGTDVTWVRERDIWCRIEGLSSRLKVEAMAREPQITHEIVVRQEDDLDPTKRLVVTTGTATVDLTDYTEAWRANETSGPLLGVNGDDIPVIGTVGSLAGHIEDPPGINLSRGLLRPIGDAGVDAYFARAFAASDIFDIRGAISCTMAMWFFLPASNTDGPTGFTIHNPANANGQALQLISNHFTFGANPAPLFFMFDGITPFNFLSAQANDAVSPPGNTWQFNAGGYDADRNKIFHFWGRAAGESYYAEADGFPAGFGYTGAAAGCQNSFGQYEGVGGGTNIAQRIDQPMWWNGRALSFAELAVLWNDHAGRALDDLMVEGTGQRTFMIAGIPENVDERGRLIRFLAVEGVAT